MDLGMLILRLVVGGLMIGHGTQKLFGWFGGHGLQGTAGWLGSMGFRQPRSMALLNGGAEAVGGLLLLAGFLTPLGAAAIAGVLFTAIVSVHKGHGLWNQNGGAELPLVLATSAIVTVLAGPARFSVDAALGLDLAGVAWGVAALLVALVAAAAVLSSRDHAAPAEEASETRTAA